MLVAPGYALDRCGNEICVDESVLVVVAARALARVATIGSEVLTRQASGRLDPEEMRDVLRAHGLNPVLRHEGLVWHAEGAVRLA